MKAKQPTLALVFIACLLAGVVLACRLPGRLLGSELPVVTSQPAGPIEADQPASSPALASPQPALASPTQPAAAPPQPDTPTPNPSPAASSTPAPSTWPAPCAEDLCIFPLDFPLLRPVEPPGRNVVDVSYRFGSNDRGKRDPHHGVEFLNSFGTPVIASADGVVALAGDDQKTIFGLYRNFYGNFIVLEHHVTGLDQPLFTLYAHLSKIEVGAGEQVSAGQKIGEVGATGAATGSHLHFEVRLGENSYPAARNPELWINPLLDDTGQLQGAIAGRIVDAQGKPVRIPNILVERLSGPGLPAQDSYYLSSYAENKLAGLAPWNENFALGDLPAGEYQISFIYRTMQQSVVEVLPGQLTVVTFHIQE